MEPMQANTSNLSGFWMSKARKLQVDSLKAKATPPWEKPAAPGSLLRVSRPTPAPSLRSSMSSSNVGPLVNHVSVSIAMSVFSSEKQSSNERILGHRDLAFVLTMEKFVTDLSILFSSSRDETSGGSPKSSKTSLPVQGLS